MISISIAVTIVISIFIIVAVTASIDKRERQNDRIFILTALRLGYCGVVTLPVVKENLKIDGKVNLETRWTFPAIWSRLRLAPEQRAYPHQE